MTHYDVLGVAPDASQVELNSAFRRRARVLHPDTSSGDKAAMQELLAAWEEIRTPERRRVYDAGLRRSADDPAANPAPPADDWGEIIVDAAPTTEADDWGEEIVDGAPDVVDDWGQEVPPPWLQPQNAYLNRFPHQQPFMGHPPQFPPPTTRRPLAAPSRLRSWRHVLTGLLVVYSVLPIALDTIVRVIAVARRPALDPQAVSSAVLGNAGYVLWFAFAWVLAHLAARRRVRTGTMAGYVAYAAAVALISSVLMAINLLAGVACLAWLILYVVVVELWRRRLHSTRPGR
jgi:hypothetical protein